MSLGAAAFLGQFIGGLVPAFLVSRLLLLLLRDWKVGVGRFVFAHVMSLLVLALVAGVGRADGGAFAPVEAGLMYLLPQAAWLAFDLLRARFRRSSELKKEKAAEASLGEALAPQGSSVTQTEEHGVSTGALGNEAANSSSEPPSTQSGPRVSWWRWWLWAPVRPGENLIQTLLRVSGNVLRGALSLAVLVGLIAGMVAYIGGADQRARELAQSEIVLEAFAGPSNGCPAETPVAITVYNESRLALMRMRFDVSARRPGTSTDLVAIEYGYNGGERYWDRIVPPGHLLTMCYRVFERNAALYSGLIYAA
jgi:hypothetical protein